MKQWQKKVAAAMMAMATIGLIAGCGGGDKKAAADTIKIGANLEMTGNQASFGQSSANAIKLAVDEINKKGGLMGKQVSLQVGDNRSEAAEATTQMQKLIDDGAIATIAPDTSSNAIAASAINSSAKVLGISPTGSNPRVTWDDKANKVRDFMFRSTFVDSFQGKVMTSFALKQLNAQKVAILVDNSSDYSKGLAKFFEEAFTAAGGTVTGTEGFLQKDTDFKATLTKIIASDPDAIFVPAYYQEVGLIIKQAREMGYTKPILGSDGWDSAKLAEIAGAQNLNNTYFSNHYAVDENNKKAMDFVAAYEKAYGVKPDAYAALAYDAMYMIADAITRANSVEPEKIKDAMAKTENFEGVSGKMRIDERHDTIKGAYIMTYKDGALKFLSKVEP
ncbi:ABC transporter substrate-binding protein [Negativicoccus succinicivorans]|uniref:ABC transporter substrate-binding protein n=1 Tax=Negativicoccus succinicivorans TaxID=620903 RepID=UPI0029043B89|nr:ABC transporter substrate-binding protein [Negativicoccus succinicivorans]MDU2417649.1 ABC transporter substrate-binding protein [Negativicoccus succinicivorans]